MAAEHRSRWGRRVRTPGGLFACCGLALILSAAAIDGQEQGTDPHSPAAETGLAVVGRLVDDDRRPLPGAWIELRSVAGPRGLGPGPTSVRTDPEGRFELDGLWEGAWILTARAESWVTFRQTLMLRPSSDGVRTVDLGVLGLRPGQPVSGRVVDARGEPVAAAEIELYDEVFESWQGSGTSGEDGRFSLRTLAAGPVVVRTRSPHHPPNELELRVGPQGASGLRIELEDGFEVVGAVVDAHGHPLEGARVTPETGKGSGDRQGEGAATTDRRGRFAFPALERATAALRVRAPGWPEHRVPLPWNGASKTSVLARRLDLGPVPLPAGTRVRGRVEGLEGPDGPGAGKIEVMAVQATRDQVVTARARVGDDGSYELDGLGPGLWRIVATLHEAERQTVTELALAPGQAVAEVRSSFPSGEPLAGTIRIHGELAPSLTVTAVALDGPTWTATETNEEGRFRFADLAPGAWLLRVEDPERDFSHALAIATPSPAEPVLDLRPVSIRGRLVDGDGRGLPEARLRLRPLFEDANPTEEQAPGTMDGQAEARQGSGGPEALLGAVIGAGATTDATGAFRLWSPFQGPAELEIRSGGASWVERVDIPDDGLRDLLLSRP